MLFTSLLLPEDIYGNSLEENHIGISINRNKLRRTDDDEVILSKIDGNTSFISWLGKKQRCRSKDEPVRCDGIVYYKTREKTTICLIELKGGKIKHGVEQLEKTYETIRDASCELGISTNTIWKAIIVSTSSKPRDINDILKPLTNKLNTKRNGYDNVRFYHRKWGNEDITDFILGRN